MNISLIRYFDVYSFRKKTFKVLFGLSVFDLFLKTIPSLTYKEYISYFTKVNQTIININFKNEYS